MSEFSWHCPVCGHLNTEPMEGARIERATPCCGLSSTHDKGEKRCGCTGGYGGLHEPLNPRCDLYDDGGR